MANKNNEISRRKFLSSSAYAALGVAGHSLLKSGPLWGSSAENKLKVALVGTGIRGSGTWGKALLENYSDVLDMVGLCDINPKRLEYAKQYMGAKCLTFVDFKKMIELTKPDTVIVTTTDCFHSKYICLAMEMGCDVITEKPLATDENLCQKILDTEKKTGKKLVVTFNYRYSPDAVKIKEILMAKEIGEVTSVDFNLMNLYVNAESEDGYIRDACVFRKKINIWDTMNVQVQYHNRVTMSYSLNAFMPYEGYFVGFNGTKGRLDARIFHNQPWKPESMADFRITQNFGKTQAFGLTSGGSGHWGADRIMQDRILRKPGEDLLGQGAGSRDGALSILIGIAARRSIEQERPFKIEELVKI